MQQFLHRPAHGFKTKRERNHIEQQRVRTLRKALRLERCADALPVWERFLELEPSSGQTTTAQKAMALCRMRIQQDRAQTG